MNSTVFLYAYGYMGWLQMIGCWIAFFSSHVSRDPKLYGVDADQKKHWTSIDFFDDREGMAAYYFTLVLAQIGAALSATTRFESLFSYGLPNVWLSLCIVFELVLASACCFNSKLQTVFSLAPLTVIPTIVSVSTMVGIILIEEVRKLVLRAQEKRREKQRP